MLLRRAAAGGDRLKAEQGIWPSKAPLGYLNVAAKDGRKIIEPDTAMAPMVTKLFEWNGKLHQGKHEPLVSIELWERVQGVLTGRNTTPIHSYGREFAFSGLMKCGDCGCAVVAEIKKGKYIYYHCTGHADGNRGNPSDCRRKYVREEALEAQFAALLDQLYFDKEVLEWVREALKSSHSDERREHEEAIKRCQAEYKRLEDRLNAMYLDKLDGRIDADFHDRTAKAWKTEQIRLLREIERHTDAEHSYMDDGIRLLELAQNARELFAKQEAHEKKRLLNLVLSNSIWHQGEVAATFRQPFDLLVKTNADIAAQNGPGGDLSTGHTVWLGD